MEDTGIRWIDTHVHWDASEFDADREQALIRAKAAGVVACFNPSVDAGGFARIHQLSEESNHRADWPRLLPAYGIHPLYVGEAVASDLDRLDQQLTIHRPMAIGEIGLDGIAGAPEMAKQCHWFEAQLALAVKHGLPVLLHVRHAVEAVIQALKRVHGAHQKIPGGIAHAFNGSESQADQLMRMGFFLGFGGSLTYEGSTRIRRLAAKVPLTQMVLETDAPDMPPVWLARARNEPAELPNIAHVLANLRGVPVHEVARQTTANAQTLMGGDFLMPSDGAHAHSP